MTEDLKKIFPEAKDFLPLLGTDYVEFYVGNAKQAAHFYKTALGFQSLAYAGLETGVTDRTSYVVVQDKIRLMFTTPMPGGKNDIESHIIKHGDGVKAIAIWVEDAKKAWRVLFSFSFEQKCSSAAEFYAGSWRDAMLLLAERCKTSFAHWLQHLA